MKVDVLLLEFKMLLGVLRWTSKHLKTLWGFVKDMAHDVYKKLSAGMDQLAVRYESIGKQIKAWKQS